jgi:proteasome lid subunit RPN8/RPN11
MEEYFIDGSRSAFTDRTYNDKSIEQALDDAIVLCGGRTDKEEDGGIILHKDGEFVFFPIRNSNTGTDVAPYLYSADRDEYAKKILPMLKKGWGQYSFHTHPQFMPYPSNVDMTQLFPGFPDNYIYSDLTKQVYKYTWIDPLDLKKGVNGELVEL